MEQIFKTLRGPKIFNMALFDWVATLVSAIFINYLYQPDNINIYTSLKIFIILIILAIIVHYIFDIPTMLNYYIGLADYKDVIASR